METYLRIVTHPLLWIIIIVTAMTFLTQGFLRGKSGKTKRRRRVTPLNWLQKHYVAVVLLATSALALTALSLYLVEIGMSVAELVDRLRRAAFDAETEPDDLRNYAYAVAALIGVLAASATIFFSVIKVWINERSARGAEEGLITDRINKAVAGLGAEKTVSRIGRPTTIGQIDGSTRTIIEWSGKPVEKVDGEQIMETDDWQVFSETEPNLEVRIGAIYALERIAQDSDRDHIQIMEILCAYIRQNAPASDAQETLVQKWRRENEAFAIEDRAPFPDEDDIREAARKLKPPRADIHAALDVLKRRRSHQINLERQDPRPADKRGYRLDLRHTNLQGADLESAQLAKARLAGAHLEGADLDEAKLEDAWLFGVRLEGAALSEADMKGAVLSGAHLEGAGLREAHLDKAWLVGAHLEGAVLNGAHLEGAVLSGAHLEGAVLSGAHLKGAVLNRAHLERAELYGAHLEGADLYAAHLKGAEFYGAHLNGAVLSESSFDATTSLKGATIRGAAVQDVDFSTLDLSQDQISSLFGDETTILPSNVTPPDWHRNNYQDDDDFDEAWQAHKKAHSIP